MSDSNKNKLDKLFQNKFSDNTAAENGWNVPPIELFENAMDAIEPEKKDRKPLWLPLFIVTILIGGLTFMFVYNHMMFDKLDTKIDSLQFHNEQILNQNRETSTITNTINQSTQTETSITKKTIDNQHNNSLSNNSQKNVVANKNTNNESSALRFNSNKETEVNKDDLAQNGQNNSLSNSKTGSQTSNLNNEQIKNNEQPMVAFAQNALLPEQSKKVQLADKKVTKQLPILPSLETNLLDNELLISPLLNQDYPISTSQINKSNRFVPYLLVGTNLSSFSMNGDPLENASLTKYDENCLGSQFGLGLIQQISNRWSLDYSLSYKSIVNHSIYTDETNYKKSNEYLNDFGLLIYTDEITVLSPVGVFVSNIKIPVQANEMQDGDVLQNTANTRQLFHIINTSIGLNFTALQKDNLALILNGGLGLNHILNAKQDMNTEVYFKNKLMASDSYNVQPSFTNNSFFISGYVGLGLKYQITDKFSLTLDNGFERSLSSLNTIQSANAPSTILHSFNTGLKVGYFF